jgi:hypothetical protein
MAPPKKKKKPAKQVELTIVPDEDNFGKITKTYLQLITEELPAVYVSPSIRAKFDSFIGIVYYDSSRNININQITPEEDDGLEEEEHDEKKTLVSKHRWYMPEFMSIIGGGNPMESAFKVDERTSDERDAVKKELMAQVMGEDMVSHPCVLYPSKHKQRNNFYLGATLINLILSMLLVGLMVGSHRFSRSNVSFTFAELQSMWGDSPTGRTWPASLISVILLPLIVFPAVIWFAWIRNNSFNPSIKEEHEHERVFWGATACTHGWWAVMAATAVGQTELFGLMGIFMLAATSFLLYSVVHCFIHQFIVGIHLAVSSIPAVVILIACATARSAALDIATAITWIVFFSFSHLIFSRVVYDEDKMHYASAQRMGDIYLEHFMFRIDKWLRQRTAEDILENGIMFDTDSTHIMTGESWMNWVGSSFLRYFEKPPVDAAVVAMGARLSARAVVRAPLKVITFDAKKPDDPHLADKRDDLFDAIFPWRRTLRFSIGAMFILHMLGIVALCVLSLTTASAWARIGMQNDHELVSTGKWPVAYISWLTICLSVMAGCWHMFVNFDQYMKETFYYHGVSPTRFTMLAFVDWGMIVLVLSALEATDCNEVLFLSAYLFLANLFLVVYRESSVHDWYFWALLIRLSPWIMVFVRAMSIDGDLDDDRTPKRAVAFAALAGHGAEIVTHFLTLYSNDRTSIDWWGGVEMGWIIARTALHALIFAWILSMNMLLIY